ncbi:hypothetical protein ACFPOF_23930 [Cohnella soli]|uniref:Helix-turn-helix domain-containing protein n=1 Tax=Cohnella soli TaxID=425005 RepID=A0ABW0HX14_9BACL
MSVKKGQKLVTYSFETKKKAIEMRLQGMTKLKVAEALGIEDIGRLKIWMRRFKQMGDFGHMDHRGKRREYTDGERYVKRLEMENADKYHDMLPKVGAQISMSRRGNCYDNASMESFFSKLNKLSPVEYRRQRIG